MVERAPFIASCVADRLEGDRSVLVPWWSITKTCLAACVLVLVAGGRLDLDRPMPGRRFTLRQLLQHTSGLSCYTEHPDYDPALDRHEDPWTDERLLALSESVSPLFPPGQGWSYSNTGYFLVRRLIEQTTGNDIERALKTLVLGPLGISDVFIARTRADLRRSTWGDEDDFHPGWVAHGLLMGHPADAALFMHRLFTGALLPAPLRAAMRERHPVERRSSRPAVADGGLRTRADDGHRLAAWSLHRPFRAGAGQRGCGLSLSRSRSAADGRSLRADRRPGHRRARGARRGGAAALKARGLARAIVEAIFAR